MINIRPVSDLRNKFQEIDEIVSKKNETVFLTKNGYGSVALLSIKKYETIMKNIDVEQAEQIKNIISEE